MGACQAKLRSISHPHPKCYLHTKQRSHCCLDDCFDSHTIDEVTKLRQVRLSWHITKQHEHMLKQCLQQYRLDDIAMIIVEYLESYQSPWNFLDAFENYRGFIRTEFSLLSESPKNRRICDIWYDKIAQMTRPHGKREEFKRIKCAVAGAGAVGKTSLTVRFLVDEWRDSWDATIEDNYFVQIPLTVDQKDFDKWIALDPPGFHSGVDSSALYHNYQQRSSQQIILDILDTAAAKQFGYNSSRLWFRECTLFFLVFDVQRQSTFTEIQQMYQAIRRAKDGAWNESHRDTEFGFICVGNKCDLRAKRNMDHSWPARVPSVNMRQAMKWFQQERLPYIETSAKTGKNVHFLFRHAIFECWIQSHTGCMHR